MLDGAAGKTLFFVDSLKKNPRDVNFFLKDDFGEALIPCDTGLVGKVYEVLGLSLS